RPGNPDWPIVRPADAEVYVDPDSRDVCVRKRGSHEYLGSFARAWLSRLVIIRFISVVRRTCRGCVVGL
ncbi:MAG: hypothetical protein ACXWFY_02110, partial [Chthoniobacterales bacterium]